VRRVRAPLCAALFQVVGLGIAVARVVHGTDEDHAGAVVAVQVLVKEGVVVEVRKHQGRGRVQRGDVSRLGEPQVDELRRRVFAGPPRPVDLEADHVQSGRSREEALEETAPAPDADDLNTTGNVLTFRPFLM
jgi:hypothetical protein